jgi:glycosyltransferase involved in cell wall biosynthesis
MKNLLMVTAHFPPSNSVGAVRPANFVKYLAEFGWQAVVLTPDRGQRDRNEQPSRPVYYAAYPTLERAFSLARRYVRKPKPSKAAGAQESVVISLDGRRQLIVDWLMIPDAGLSWVPFGLTTAMKIAEAHPIDAIMTTAPEFSCHLIGLILARRLRRPWIAEFRDPWLSSPFINFPSGLHRKVHAWLEQRVISSASHLVVTTEFIGQDLSNRYAGHPPGKFTVIHNGYDPEDFKGLKSRRDHEDKLIYIAHSGSFYGERSPLNFLRALTLFNAAELNKLRVIFLGRNMAELTVFAGRRYITTHTRWPTDPTQKAVRISQVGQVYHSAFYQSGRKWLIGPGEYGFDR